MKFPLAMTAGLADTFSRTSLKPRPEWQITAEPQQDTANPFRILPAQIRLGERTPHPMINKRFPIVLMLEPLHACNLTCTGCGRIREYESTIKERIPVEECLAAVDECGAPMVSICGGEPMMYPQIGQLVAGILERDKHFSLHQRHVHPQAPERIQAGQALLLQRPSGRHGEDARHVRGARRRVSGSDRRHQGRQGRGLPDRTNTTVYKETDMKEIEELFEYLETLNVDVHQLSPAYGYSAVNDREIFMTRDDVNEKFKGIDRMLKKYPMRTAPLYHGLSAGRAGIALHRVGNSDLQHQRLERPLLRHHRRALQDVRRAHDQDALAKLRAGQRSAVRALHGALRLSNLPSRWASMQASPTT